MYKHILIPTDGSNRSKRAISAGIALAKEVNAMVTGLFVVSVTYIPEADDGDQPMANAVLSAFSQQAEGSGVKFNCVSMKGDTPQDIIVQFANEKACDLIVMGTHGRSKVGKFFLGSVAASVIAECDIPVLLYR